MKVIYVTACRSCPFLVYCDSKYAVIYCANNLEKHLENIDIIPEWCRLEDDKEKMLSIVNEAEKELFEEMSECKPTTRLEEHDLLVIKVEVDRFATAIRNKINANNPKA